MSTYHRISEALYTELGLSPEQLIEKKDGGEILFKLCKGETKYPRFQISAFKDNRKARYKSTGFRVYNRFMEHGELEGGEILSLLVELGDIPIFDPSTKELVKAIESLAIPDNLPLRTAIEKAPVRGNKIHAHMAVWTPDIKLIKESVTVNGKRYRIKMEIIGNNPKWNGLYTFQEQVKRYITYLYKPSIAAGNPYSGKMDIKHAEYMDWFIDQYELHKLTQDESKEILSKRPRLSWNKNINSEIQA